MADATEPTPGATALLIIDMINDLDFEGGEQLAPAAVAAAGRIRALRDRADAALYEAKRRGRDRVVTCSGADDAVAAHADA